MVLGFPVLLLGVAGAVRGGVTSLLAWSGALLSFAYVGIAHVMGLPFGWMLLGRLLLLSLTIYVLMGLFVVIDHGAAAALLRPAVRRRLVAGLLVALGALFLLLAMGVFVAELASEVGLARTEVAVVAADVVIAPAFVVAGILLWRDNALGYVAGLGLLVQAGILFLSLALAVLAQPARTGSSPAWADAIIVGVFGILCLSPVLLTTQRLHGTE